MTSAATTPAAAVLTSLCWSIGAAAFEGMAGIVAFASLDVGRRPAPLIPNVFGRNWSQESGRPCFSRAAAKIKGAFTPTAYRVTSEHQAFPARARTRILHRIADLRDHCGGLPVARKNSRGSQASQRHRHASRRHRVLRQIRPALSVE